MGTPTLLEAAQHASRTPACSITGDVYCGNEEMMAARRAGRRAYGWTDDDSSLIPAEALELRRVVADHDAGKSMKQIVRELNDRHLPTASGNQWSVSALTRMLKNPRLIGRRADSLGRIIQQGPLVCPPVFETEDQVAQWRRVRARLMDPSRRQKGRAADSLLEDVERKCGVCGCPMYRKQPKGRAARYACHEDPGCGRVSVQAQLLEDFVGRETVAHAAQVITPAVSEVKIAAWWTTATLEQRRELVAGMVESVVVHPAAAGTGWGDSRLTISWSDMPEWPAALAES